MHTVIRVQDAYGRGMFYSTTLEDEDVEDNISVYHISKLASLFNRHSEFPNAEEDFLLKQNIENRGLLLYKLEDWRFSFQNLNQFEAWVTRKEVKILNAYGYRVFKIVASDVIVGDFQNIFHKDSIVSSEDITEIFL